MKKKLVALFCVVATIASALSGCGTTANEQNEKPESSVAESKTESSAAVESSETVEVESEYPEYLNLDSAYPIIKDEYAGTIKLSLMVVKQPATGDWENLWVSKYLKDKYNIELEVEYIDNAAIAERKSLMLNSGDMPDMIWNMNISTAELVKYGEQEGVLLACDEYMNETLTPNIMKYWNDNVKTACTLSDGHVYSLPSLTDDVDVNHGNLPRMFINKAWLDELNLEMPRTLDEFVDVLYKLKEADPAGVGSENFYPLGGGMEVVSGTWYLLNALGYNVHSSNWYGMKPALRDGEVVIPAYDMDVYEEFLKLMNQFYNDGIISPNYFTMEQTEVNALMVEGKCAVYAEAATMSGIETWDEWEACYPLTSDYQEEPEVFWPNTATVGGFAINAETEYPELCMRLADTFYNNEDDMCAAFWGGALEGSEYDYEGYNLMEWDAANEKLATLQFPEGYSAWTYYVEFISGFMPKFGAYQLREANVRRAAEYGYTMPAKPVYDLTNPDNHFRATIETNVAPYVAKTYPQVYFVTTEVNEEIVALETVLEPYVKEQVAMFITGRRPLSETAAFVKELESMGMDELLQKYTDIYNN